MTRLLLTLCALALAGCVTTPTPPPTRGEDPAVYRPTQRVTYPAPR